MVEGAKLVERAARCLGSVPQGVDLAEAAGLDDAQQGQQHHSAHQDGGLDDLYPGGGEHAAKGHIHRHQGADGDYRQVELEAEDNGDQPPCAHHLSHQIDQRDGDGTGAQHHPGAWVLQTALHHIPEGVLAHPPQGADQNGKAETESAQGRDEVEGHIHPHQGVESDNTEDGARRHVVPGNGEAVLGAADLALGGVERRLAGVASSRPEGNAEGDGNGDEEVADRGGNHGFCPPSRRLARVC